MHPDLTQDEDLLRRLPLPLAQLCRRAHNARTPLERHLAAFYLWEAGLKVLGSVAVISYAGLAEAEPELAECLQSLARPALGHWWGIVRRLLPVLAEGRGEAFAPLRDLLLGKRRDDLPRAAGLDAALREHLEGRAGAHAGVYLAELFERLVRYRNKEIGHGAAGQRPADFHERLGRSLLLGAVEVLGRLDVLAGRRLLYVAEVRQAPAGWLVQRYELAGETARRVEALALPRDEAARLPEAGQVYLAGGDLLGLHPLVVYDPEANEAALLNARPGRGKTEYLCYTSGRTLVRPDLGTAQRGLLARVLGMEVSDEQVSRWAERSRAEEPTGPESPPARWTLGEYELLSELGRGGMGVVYRAWQPSLGRQVAVKKLLHAGDPRTEARFQREIRALGRVEHPHLVKVFASGSDGDQWFYAMELVEGAPLSAVCERLQGSTASVTDVDLKTWQDALSTACEEVRKAEKPLGSGAACGEASPPPAPPQAAPSSAATAGRGYVRQVVELVRQVAEAAHALHERGILHRDIKPGNVLVTADGGQAVLMDLGLAQLADDEEGRLTRTRQFVGTLRYASPEQLGGAKLDRRADVYGLGATLWELLALKPLFGVTEQTPTPDLILRVQQAEPERLRRAHPGLPRDLEAIAHKCLEKAPERRYATAADLAADLRRWREGEPVRARPVRGWERAVKWVRRRPALAAAYGLLLVALVLGLGGGGALWLWRAAEQARERAVAAEAKADDALAGEKKARQQAVQALAGEQKARAGERRANREKEAALQGQANTERLWKDRFTYLANILHADRAVQDQEWETARRLLAECPAAHRDWEWHYLQRRCRVTGLLLDGLRDDTQHYLDGLAFSPDGTRLAGGSKDGTVRIWDLQAGRVTLNLKGHTGNVQGVAFSPDGRRLASASADKTVRVWDLARGQVARTLKGHTAPVLRVAFTPDGRLASASDDGTVRVWELASGRVVQPLKTGGLYKVAFSPDGRHVFSPWDGEALRVWELASGREVLTLKGREEQEERCAAFSADGRRLACALENGTVRVWELASGREVFTIKRPEHEVQGLAFSPDGRRLATTSYQTVRVWELASGREVLTLKGHTSTVNDAAFSPDGRRLASTSENGTVRLWDLASGQEILSLKGGWGRRIAFNPDGRRLAQVADGGARIWDLASAGEALTYRTDTEGPLDFADGPHLAFSPEGRWLSWVPGRTTVRVADLSGGSEALDLRLEKDGESVGVAALSADGRRLGGYYKDKTVRVWDLAEGTVVLTLKDHADRLVSLAFSPDGRRLAGSSGADTDVRVWDLAAGGAAVLLKGHSGPVGALAFSPDGRRLARSTWDETLVWDLAGGRVALTLKGLPNGLAGLAFSPDGTQLARAATNEIQVWDLAGGRGPLTLEGHTARVTGVAFSPDGRRLVSTSEDQTVRLWDLAGGREALTFKGLPGKGRCVAFSPDGRRLAALADGGFVRLWELEPEPYWQLREAAAAERERQWPAAVLHLNRLIEREARFTAAEAAVLTTRPRDLGAAMLLLRLNTLDVRTSMADLLARRGNAAAEQGKRRP